MKNIVMYQVAWALAIVIGSAVLWLGWSPRGVGQVGLRPFGYGFDSDSRGLVYRKSVDGAMRGPIHRNFHKILG